MGISPDSPQVSSVCQIFSGFQLDCLVGPKGGKTELSLGSARVALRMGCKQ